MNDTEKNFDDFETAYVKCALWATNDESDGSPLDDNYGIDDLSPKARREVMQECEDFRDAYATDLDASGLSDARHGHNFFLTRNGHGTGFWDRGLGDVGDRLTEACEPYGTHLPYIGDNGLIYFHN